MTNRMVMGVLAVGFLGCSDAGTSLNPSLDERCPYARAPGVVLAIYPEDTHVCTYQCRIVVDGAARDSDWCGNACVFTDTAEHCRTCDRHCTGSTPYCDLNAQNYCVATPPR